MSVDGVTRPGLIMVVLRLSEEVLRSENLKTADFFSLLLVFRTEKILKLLISFLSF